jgi:hypothetical protein
MPDITPVVVILNGQPVSSINPLPTSGGGGGGSGIVEQGKQGSIASPWAGCALGNGWTWRVWGARPDDRPRENGYLDTISLSSWRSRDTNCPSSAPSPADNLPDFYARNPTLPAYLLMGPGYGGAVGEITPRE